jgi:two-component system cell cycle response regulator
LRDADWVARYGGEEFVVVLPETSLSAASQVAERCRVGLADAPLQIGNRTLQVTASFGVSGWEQAVSANAEVDKLIAAADAGVYASKAAGRNRITTQAVTDTE